MPATWKMSELVQSLWASVSGSQPKKAVPEVIVHDPEAKLPHDLDDPFFDRGVQSRMADVIAHSAHSADKK